LSTQPFVGAVDDLVAMTDGISLQRIDEAAAVGRPAGVGVTARRARIRCSRRGAAGFVAC
jgi:hypothetical protein